MKNQTKIVFTVFTSICSLLMASISVSFAWLKKNYNQVDIDVNGSVLAQYFDKREFNASDDPVGTTADNPFVITTYRHYENLVKLHHTTFENASGDTLSFSDQHYYFEIGKQYEENGEFLVHEFTDLGAQTGNKSKYLNLNALDPLEPIGSEEHPFVSTIEGHGITVKNFTVSALADTTNEYYDFGIFGYVGNNDADNSGNISNIYYSDFKLDAEGLIPTHANERDYHVEHKRNSFVGYLCGHVYDVNSFSNVYINNCSMKGGSSQYASVNNYGYFGFVELDNQGTTAGSGNNYNFDLNSSAIYDYFNEHYNEEEFTYDENGDEYSLANAKMRVRNTEYDDTVNAADQNFSVGVTKENNNYRLIGDYDNGATNNSTIDVDRNYSMSTLGYYGANINKIDHTYKAYYKNEADAYVMPSEDAQVTTYPIEEQTGKGNYYYYDKTERQWKYYYSDNELNTYQLSLSFPTISLTGLTNTTGWNNSTRDAITTVTLCVDDVEYIATVAGTEATEVWTYTVTNELSGGTINVSFELDDIVITGLSGGTHFISLIVLAETQRSSGFLNLGTSPCYSIGYYGSFENSTVTPSQLELSSGVRNQNIIEASKDFSNDDIKFDKNKDTQQLFAKETCIPEVFLGDSNFISNMYGREVDDDNNVSETYILLKDKVTSFYYEFGECYANSVERQIIRESIGSQFIGDDPEIVGSGYSSKSIDIVGGGITFGPTYLNLAGEKSGANITITPTVGNKFYATQYCADSLVLYLKKTPGNNLGTIDVHYQTIGAVLGVTLKVPALKKGNGTFIDFDTLNSLDTTGESEYVHNDSGTDRNIAIKKIVPVQARAASLCGIDENNNVVAIYNSSGTLTSGSETNVDRYVIAVGVQNNPRRSWIGTLIGQYINNTRITSIHFEYKADEGYCSQLGRIDFRSADDVLPDDLTSSVFTVYIVAPADPTKKFRLTVNFDNVTSTYKVWFYTNYETNLKMYLYVDGYTVNVNGSEVLNAKGGAAPIIEPVADESLLDYPTT